ncbi:lipid II:glycine glycyltransferase FemX [Syntrophus buswellii]|uniref:lipid II:glycine glycyltransferase FemX n=1 Tax=Syntrophus buswellii TaxID=43774 RepID=UPI0038D3D700
MLAKKIAINWHPELSIYASEPFLKAVGDEYGWLGGFDEDQKLRCILPYTIIKKAFFRMVRFRVETIPIGEDISIDQEKAFLNSVVDYFRNLGADMIIPATTNSIFRTYPDGSIAAPYGTFIIDLTQPEEILLRCFNSTHRRKVRQAAKQGVQIHNGIEFLEKSYELVRDTFKRSNMGFMSYEEFRSYVFSLDRNVQIMVADYQGIIQGCIVVPFSLHTAYYVYGGSIQQPQTGATNLLHWEAMKQFRKLGVKRYDFVGVRINPKEGTRQEGLYAYKQRFGGKLIQGYMWKYPIRPLKYFAYAQAVRFQRGGDIVDQERHKFGTI